MNLSKRQIAATKASIKKWERIVAGKERDRGGANCRLCKVYYSDYEDCSLCPVSLFSGYRNCERTPYHAFKRYGNSHGYYFYLSRDSRDGRDGIPVFDETSKRLAQAELDFLRTILAEENQ